MMPASAVCHAECLPPPEGTAAAAEAGVDVVVLL
jgi:hypothetical protein